MIEWVEWASEWVYYWCCCCSWCCSNIVNEFSGTSKRTNPHSAKRGNKDSLPSERKQKKTNENISLIKYIKNRSTAIKHNIVYCVRQHARTHALLERRKIHHKSIHRKRKKEEEEFLVVTGQSKAKAGQSKASTIEPSIHRSKKRNLWGVFCCHRRSSCTHSHMCVRTSVFAVQIHEKKQQQLH